MAIQSVCPVCGLGHGANPCPRSGIKSPRRVNPGASGDGEAKGMLPTPANAGSPRIKAAYESTGSATKEEAVSGALRVLTESGLLQWCVPRIHGSDAVAYLEVRLCLEDEGASDDEPVFNIVMSDNCLGAIDIAKKDQQLFLGVLGGQVESCVELVEKKK